MALQPVIFFGIFFEIEILINYLTACLIVSLHYVEGRSLSKLFVPVLKLLYV